MNNSDLIFKILKEVELIKNRLIFEPTDEPQIHLDYRKNGIERMAAILNHTLGDMLNQLLHKPTLTTFITNEASHD